jgi:hypothetical protein
VPHADAGDGEDLGTELSEAAPAIPWFERFTPSDDNTVSPGCAFSVVAVLGIVVAVLAASVIGWRAGALIGGLAVVLVLGGLLRTRLIARCSTR